MKRTQYRAREVFEKAKKKLDLEVDRHLCARETRQVRVSIWG